MRLPGGGGGGVLSTFGRFNQRGVGVLSTFGRFNQCVCVWGGGGGAVHFWLIQPVWGGGGGCAIQYRRREPMRHQFFCESAHKSDFVNFKKNNYI